MDLVSARRLLDLPPGYSRADLARAFRAEVRAAHPDHGGDPRQAAALVEARDLLVREFDRPRRAVVVVDDSAVMAKLLRRIRRVTQGRPSRVV